MRDLIIYELHVGAFTPEGTYDAAIEKLPHLVDLGITAIELMPLADFPGGRNWGYDGVFPYAPASAYGTPDQLRKLVEAAHGQNLAVILDVVYNHLGPDGNYMGAFNPAYFNRRQKTPWGDGLNYSDPAVRAFFLENAPYWMNEFHIDGFRLDATHAIADPSERHVLAEITDLIHANGGFAIAEDERNERLVCTSASEGGLGFDGCWADDFHHVVRVMALQEREGHYAGFKGSANELVETLQHGWLYRGQTQPQTGKRRGTDPDALAPEQFVYCISNHDQVGNNAFGERMGQRVDPAFYRAASALLLLSPYTPMLFMGQEWNASSPFLFFTDHKPELGKKVTEGRRREFSGFSAFRDPEARERIPDPQDERTFLQSKLKWDELPQRENASLVALHRELIRLRRTHAVLEDRSREYWTVEKLPDEIIRLCYTREGIGQVAVLVSLKKDLSPDAGAALNPGGAQQWSLLLSTNEERFGGPGDAVALVYEQRRPF